MSSTTIRIDTETREQLRAFGRMGESYDVVIKRLLEVARLSDLSRSRGTSPRPAGPPGLPSNLG